MPTRPQKTIKLNKSKSKIKKNSLYDTITQLNLDRKIIDISMAKAQVPPSYQDDAAQEIRIAWLGVKANETLSDGEIASYAHTIAYHVALKLRRDVGGPVRLPGSAFRKRSDGSTYVQPGHLAAPIPWEDLAETLIAEEDAARLECLPISPLSIEALDDKFKSSPETGWYGGLSNRQRRIILLLKNGYTLNQIESDLGIQHNTLQRNIRIIRKHIDGDTTDKTER